MKKTTISLSLAIFAAVTADASACGPLLARRPHLFGHVFHRHTAVVVTGSCQSAPQALPAPQPAPPAKPVVDAAAIDALDQLNAQRATRGLRPYLRDENLMIAARSAAVFRMRLRMHGHTANDFQFLPSGCTSVAAGCAAWPAAMNLGFGACGTDGSYTYAGAATVLGPDGQEYHHAFYR